MNKQEALKRIEVQKETLIRLTGWAVYVYIEELIKSLDEPQKVKVPPFVADWIERSKQEKRNLCNALNNGGEKMLFNVKVWIIFPKLFLNGFFGQRR